jgi:hypothetical protein
MTSKLLSDFGIHKAGMILGVASNVVRAFETEFAQDHDTKTAAIAALIDVLEAHKNVAPDPAPVNAPVAQAPAAPAPAPQARR